jgi:hypothetical protein
MESLGSLEFPMCHFCPLLQNAVQICSEKSPLPYNWTHLSIEQSPKPHDHLLR